MEANGFFETIDTKFNGVFAIGDDLGIYFLSELNHDGVSQIKIDQRALYTLQTGICMQDKETQFYNKAKKFKNRECIP